MSSNSAEQQLGKWLREIPGAWVHHPVDHPKARYWKPADFLVAINGILTLVESKEVSKGGRFPLSNWTAQQRNAAEVAWDAGVYYVLCVHFKETNQWIAIRRGVGLRHLSQDRTGSLTSENGESFLGSKQLGNLLGDPSRW